MGTGGDSRRGGAAGRRRGTLLAGVVGATAVGAAAIAGRRQRRRRLDAAISPEAALAGPPPNRLAPVDAGHEPTNGAALPADDITASSSVPDAPLGADLGPGGDAVRPRVPGPVAAARGAAPAGATTAAPAPVILAHDARAPGREAPAPDPPAPAPASRPSTAPTTVAPATTTAPTDVAPATPPEPYPAGPNGEPGRHRPGRPRRQPRVVAVVVSVVVLALVIIGGIVAASTSADDSDAATAGETSTTDPGPTSTTITPVSAPEAFGLASQRLTAAGSFRYTGSAVAPDVSDVRPALWLEVELAVDGEVDTAAGRLRELAVTADGEAAETITDGPTVWGRRAQTVDQLAEQPYEFVPALSDGEQRPRGAARLPVWLGAAVDPVDVEPDEHGRRRFQATIPADVFGEMVRGQPAVAASATVTLDGAGDPVRIEIASVQDDSPLHLVFDITALGAPVDIQPPA